MYMSHFQNSRRNQGSKFIISLKMLRQEQSFLNPLFILSLHNARHQTERQNKQKEEIRTYSYTLHIHNSFSMFYWLLWTFLISPSRFWMCGRTRTSWCRPSRWTEERSGTTSTSPCRTSCGWPGPRLPPWPPLEEVSRCNQKFLQRFRLKRCSGTVAAIQVFVEMKLQQLLPPDPHPHTCREEFTRAALLLVHLRVENSELIHIWP